MCMACTRVKRWCLSVQVMQLVKNLTSLEGITICTTIHSPTPRTFQTFDRVLIVQRGEVAYFGKYVALCSHG